MRYLLAASLLMFACTGQNIDYSPPDMGRAPEPAIVFPSTDMARPAADMARDAWVCVPAYQANNQPCGCADLPCCMFSELEFARRMNGLQAYPNDTCGGVTVSTRPSGYAEECRRFNTSTYRCVVVAPRVSVEADE